MGRVIEPAKGVYRGARGMSGKKEGGSEMIVKPEEGGTIISY